MNDYQTAKTFLQQKATHFYNLHKNAVESWEHGAIAKIWVDSDNVLCIEYESGKWWHYNDAGEWW